MIDAHCHIDFERFDDDRAEVLARARDVGVRGWICAGVEPRGWDRQDAVQQAHEDVHVMYGIHPHIAARMAPDALRDALARLGGRARFAVGETGLDGSKYVPRGSLDLQLDAFRAQLRLARERDLPVVLHILYAHGKAMEVLQQDGVPAAGGMVHSYSGPADLVGGYEALGLYISFAAGVTRPSAKRVLQAARAVSRHRLLVETDCPDQIPSGVAGARNLPQWLVHIVDAAAAARGEPAEEVASATARNARRLFGLGESQ